MCENKANAHQPFRITEWLNSHWSFIDASHQLPSTSQTNNFIKQEYHKRTQKCQRHTMLDQPGRISFSSKSFQGGNIFHKQTELWSKICPTCWVNKKRNRIHSKYLKRKNCASTFTRGSYHIKLCYKQGLQPDEIWTWNAM